MFTRHSPFSLTSQESYSFEPVEVSPARGRRVVRQGVSLALSFPVRGPPPLAVAVVVGAGLQVVYQRRHPREQHRNKIINALTR